MSDGHHERNSSICHIDLFQMECLFAVRKYGNITRAASELNLSQTAVSRTIKHIEGCIGFPLFERVARGVLPTPACHTLCQEWEKAHGKFMKGWEAAREVEYGGDSLRIVDMLFIDKEQYLAPILERFESLHPNASLHVGEVSRLYPEDLLNGEYDMAIAPVFMCEDLPAGLERADIITSPVLAFMHRNNKLARSGFDIEDFAKESVILGRGTDLDEYSDHVITQFQIWGVKPRNFIFYDSIMNMRMAVFRNMGIMFVNSYFPFPSHPNIVSRPINGWTGVNSFVWKKDSRNRLISDFIRCAEQAMRQ